MLKILQARLQQYMNRVMGGQVGGRGGAELEKQVGKKNYILGLVNLLE